MPKVGQNFGVMMFTTLAFAASAGTAMARKTNQAIYEDPFDIGAGGASLTRASKEGRIFANPATMPYGGTFHRWLGSTFSLLVNKESVDTGRKLVQSAQGGGDEESEEEQSNENAEFVDAALANPIRVGWGFALSWVTNNFGVSIFSRFEPEIRAREFGFDPDEPESATGLPTVSFSAESYHGAALGTAIRTPFRWLSLGLTGKYLFASEPDISVSVTSQEDIAEFRNPTFLQDLTAHNTGVGIDAGVLVFLQGDWVDFSIAAKADDVGNTKLTGPNTQLTEFKQVTSAGLGLTFHTGADAIHMAVDYRDIQNVYEEPLFKRVYAGTKILLRTYIGLAAGYYHGYPSYGAEIDLIFMRVAATAYTREMSNSPNTDPRNIYLASLSFGF